MFEIHARELRATFLRNHSVRRHKGISKAPQRKAPHRAPSRRQLKPTKRPGHLARNHATTTRQETASTPPNPGWADVRSSRPAHRRADTTKHAEPNAPVGAKAARSGRVWSPGHNGPACPSTLRLTSCQRAPWRRGSTHTGHAPQPGPPRRGLSRVSWLRAPQRWGGCGVPTT